MQCMNCIVFIKVSNHNQKGFFFFKCFISEWKSCKVYHTQDEKDLVLILIFLSPYKIMSQKFQKNYILNHPSKKLQNTSKFIQIYTIKIPRVSQSFWPKHDKICPWNPLPPPIITNICKYFPKTFWWKKQEKYSTFSVHIFQKKIIML